jgi:hypothetical protein
MPRAHFITNPDHWHRRAAEMRKLAEGVTDLDAKAAMLGIADDYAKLASRAGGRSVGVVPLSKQEPEPA